MKLNPKVASFEGGLNCKKSSFLLAEFVSIREIGGSSCILHLNLLLLETENKTVDIFSRYTEIYSNAYTIAPTLPSNITRYNKSINNI